MDAPVGADALVLCRKSSTLTIRNKGWWNAYPININWELQPGRYYVGPMIVPGLPDLGQPYSEQDKSLYVVPWPGDPFLWKLFAGTVKPDNYPPYVKEDS